MEIITAGFLVILCQFLLLLNDSGGNFQRDRLKEIKRRVRERERTERRKE